MLSEDQKLQCKQNRLDMLKDIRTLSIAKGLVFDVKKARRLTSASSINAALGEEVKDNDLFYPKLRDRLLVLWLGAL